MAYTGQAGRNPFEEDDDDFAKKPYTVTERYGRGEVSYDDDPPAAPLTKQQLLEQEKQQSMNRQLESTRRCMASIYDSEAVGIATAEELVRQGEQLDNVEMKTEKINADTRVSQRHLNGIKSIFGGIKNWWQGEPKKEADTFTPPPRNGPLRQTLESSQNRTRDDDGSLHPGLRIRSDNAAGFYDDDIQTFGSQSGAQSYARGSDRGVAPTTSQATSSRSAQWNEYEASLDKNLDVMSSGLSQLTVLARGLKDEIETQNDQLDRIMPKVDRADDKLRDQNRQMRKILGTDK